MPLTEMGDHGLNRESMGKKVHEEYYQLNWQNLKVNCISNNTVSMLKFLNLIIARLWFYKRKSLFLENMLKCLEVKNRDI